MTLYDSIATATLNYMEKKKLQRTDRQNRSLHAYCQALADTLNESGIPLHVFFKDIQADYTLESIKELFRSYGRAKYQKESTADFTTSELIAIAEEVNRHTSQFGVHIPWPSEEELSYQQL